MLSVSYKQLLRNLLSDYLDSFFHTYLEISGYIHKKFCPTPANKIQHKYPKSENSAIPPLCLVE